MSFKSVELLESFLASASPAELEKEWMALEASEYYGPTLDELIFFDFLENWTLLPENEIEIERYVAEITGDFNNFSIAA